MKLWGGRFTGKMDPQAWEFEASIGFDHRMGRQDVRGSLAWAEALCTVGILSQSEYDEIVSGLQAIDSELANEEFVFHSSDEDIHTAVERRLGELIGAAAGKLHTGRSRNDQVATDLRLWLMDGLPDVSLALAALQQALLSRAERDLGIIMPGYTHLQRAQAILLSHWWLSFFWPLQRDRQRLAQLMERISILPLGSGALAGVPYPIDRTLLSEALGFAAPGPNSLDSVSDRDFAAEFLFIAALIGVHLSKLSEAVALFTTAEFGFFELSDAYATGSSLMPQKKNPDPFELARGKAGALIGRLTGFLSTLKALPSIYDKDLQEDKIPLFDTYDSLVLMLPVLAGAVNTLAVNPNRMRQAVDPELMATDLADYLVGKGLPFRKAHTLAGKAVVLAQSAAKPLDTLTLEEFRSLDIEADPALFDPEVYAVFDPARSIARRSAIGGTASDAVLKQIDQARIAISKP